MLIYIDDNILMFRPHTVSRMIVVAQLTQTKSVADVEKEIVTIIVFDNT